MSELRLPRLLSAAKEFNVGMDTLVGILVKSGFNKDELTTTTKLSEDMYGALIRAFRPGIEYAIHLCQVCAANNDYVLDLSNCGLIDDDFTRNPKFYLALKLCSHINTLLLSVDWSEKNEKRKIRLDVGTNNRISIFPDLGESFSNLKRIIANDIGLIDLDNIAKIASLEELYLYSNNIEDIGSISFLKQLTKLVLSKNKINDIGALLHLDKLEELDLSLNEIDNLESLGKLFYLRNLYLGNNLIESIHGINKLILLELLDLSNNKITRIEPIGQLKLLKQLSFKNNQIDKIENLSQVSSLEYLDLSSNNIRRIEGLEKLLNLQILDLSHNDIKEISGLDNLSKLFKISINYNSIKEIKNVKKIPNLKILEVGYNEIDDIEQIEELALIEELRIDNNPFLKKFPHLSFKALENHLPFIQTELLKLKETKIDSIILPLKIMLMGNHSSGKSSLVNYLIGEHNHSDTTHILRIENYYLNNEVKNLKELPSAIFYDFGGQDFYHGLYQAFIGSNGIQIIVFDKKTDYKNTYTTDKNGLPIVNFTRQYWLGQSKYLANSQNLHNHYLLVQSHLDEIDISEPSILNYKNYPGYLNNFFLSLNTNLKSEQAYLADYFELGRQYCKAFIDTQIKNYNLYNREMLVPVWYKNFLLKIINKEIYKELNREKHIPVTVDELIPFYKLTNVDDAKRKEALITDLITLERQGLLIIFLDRETMRYKIWLEPVKLVEYIQDKILTKNLLKKINNKTPGAIPKKEFEKVVHDEFILKMLVYQKVIFLHKPTDNINDDEYIIPNYLPLIEKNDGDFFFATFGLNKPDFVLKFNDFIPFGFINQMICFFGKQPDNKRFWRNQLLFTLNSTARVLIELNFEELKIKVYVQLLEDNKRSKVDILSYLFFSIMGLYLDDYTLLLNYEDFIKLKNNNFARNIDSQNDRINQFVDFELAIKGIPDDLYISIDNVWFVNYQKITALEDKNFTISAFKIKETCINIEESISLPVFSFQPFTNKRLSIMKNVFISYSHSDLTALTELKSFLVNIEREGLIEVWQDGLIQAGEDWDKKIKKSLETADICIMLLSQSFIASNYVHEVEFKTILEKRKNGNCKIIPVLVKGCDWKNWKVFPDDILESMLPEDKNDYKMGSFQMLPKDDENRLKALNKWEYSEEAWLQVIDAVKNFATSNT